MFLTVALILVTVPVENFAAQMQEHTESEGTEAVSQESGNPENDSPESSLLESDNSESGLPENNNSESDSTENNSPESGGEETSLENLSVTGEVEAFRGENVKHFMLEGGAYIAVQYNTPVHYRTEAGEWNEIDNTPVLREGIGTLFDSDGNTDTDADASAYIIENGDSVKSFAASLDAGYLFWESFGDTAVAFSLLTGETVNPGSGAEENTGEGSIGTPIGNPSEGYTLYQEPVEAEVMDAPSAFSADQNSFDAQTSPENFTSALMYEEIRDGVSLKYENYGYHIKESIIVSKPQENYNYSFLLTLDNLEAQLEEDGSICLTRVSDGEEMFRIPAPYMEDGAGEISGEVQYSLDTLEDGTYRLDVTASADWINDSERQFPVAIDPSLEVSSGSASGDITSTYVVEGTPDTT